MTTRCHYGPGKSGDTMARQQARNRARASGEPMPPGHRQHYEKHQQEEDAKRRAERVRWAKQCRLFSRSAERANAATEDADGLVPQPVHVGSYRRQHDVTVGRPRYVPTVTVAGETMDCLDLRLGHKRHGRPLSAADTGDGE